MTHNIAEQSPASAARLAGFFWLMTIVFGCFAFFVGGRLIVAGDGAATAQNIIAHEWLYRLAFTANVVATVCYIAVTLYIYLLLRPVSRSVSLFGVFVSLTGCASGILSSLLFIAPVALPGRAPEQMHAQALTFTTLSLQANDIGLFFFAFHVISIGYLVRRSSFLPRLLGTLLWIAGLCYLTSSFASFLALPFRTYLMPFVAIGGLGGEGALTVWLLLKGIDVQRWQEDTGTRAALSQRADLTPVRGF